VLLQQQQQQPSLIPLSGVGYMDQITPSLGCANKAWITPTLEVNLVGLS